MQGKVVRDQRMSDRGREISAWTPEIDDPGASDSDAWGDFVGYQSREQTVAGVLPPIRRRLRDEGSGPASFAVDLCIEPGPTLREPATERGEGFEVVALNGPVVRLVAEQAAPERVPRIETFHPLPVMTREQALERQLNRDVAREWGKAKDAAPRWMVWAAAGVVLFLLLAVVILPLVQPEETTRKRVVLTADRPDALPDDSAAQIELLKRQDEAVGLFRRFASATTTDDLLATVRNRDTVAPLVKQWPTAVKVPSSWRPSQPTVWETLSDRGRVSGILTVILPDFRPFMAFLTMEHGVLLIDWKATVGYGTADYAQLSRGEGDASEIRGSLKPADFYSSALPESDYRNYVLISPNGEESIWVYVPRVSEVADQLSRSFAGGEIVAPDTQPQRFTVKLARPVSADVARNQWMLKEVLHKEWIRP